MTALTAASTRSRWPRRGPRRVACLACTIATVALLASDIQAQVTGTPSVGRAVPELRMDVLAGRSTTVHGGAGVLWPVGRYVHLGAVAGAGGSYRRGAEPHPAQPAEREWVATARGEIVARFVIERADPSAWRLYGAAGVGMHGSRGATPTGRLFVSIGAEPGRLGGVSGIRPSIEIGLGGGVRVGFALRARERTAPG